MPDSNSLQLTEMVDAACDAFEAAWMDGLRPSIAEILEPTPSAAKSILFQKLLSLELELRARAGDWPNIVEYLHVFAPYHRELNQSFNEFHQWVAESDSLRQLQAEAIGSSAVDTKGDPDVTEVFDTISGKPSRTTPGSGSKRGSSFSGMRTPSERVLPTHIDRYWVLHEIGQGGMGTVVLAKDEVLDRQVALKLPHFDLEKDPRAIERFYREARVMASVHHPNICPVYDVGEAEGVHFLTMAYINGCNLAEHMKREAALDPRKSAKLVRKLAQAIHHAHESGVLHRDLKPSNVMLDLSGRPFITDFGLAFSGELEESTLTDIGTIIGSPAYMAPEQVLGKRELVGPASDVYSLGVILYELLCQCRPFTGNAMEILGQISAGVSPIPPTQLVVVEPGLERICLKAMANDLSERYSNAEQLADDLGAYLGMESESSSSSKPIQRSAIALLIITCAAVFLVGLAMMQPKRPGHKSPRDGVSPNLESKVPLDSQVPEIEGQAAGETNSKLGTKASNVLPPPPKFRFVDRVLMHELPTHKSLFGKSVDIDGDVAIIGAPQGKFHSQSTGLAFVLGKERTESGTRWVQKQILAPGVSENGAVFREAFGSYVAVSGDRVCVSSPSLFKTKQEDENTRVHWRGSATIYVRDGSLWKEEDILSPWDEVPTLATGPVALSGRYLMITAQDREQFPNILLYERNEEGKWKHRQTFGGSNVNESLGQVCAISGSSLVFSRLSAADELSAYRKLSLQFYVLENGRWIESQEVTIEGKQGSHNRCSLAIDGDWLALGLRSESSSKMDRCGQVRVFKKSEQGRWEYEETLYADHPHRGGFFGNQVALEGSHMLVTSRAPQSPAEEASEIVSCFELIDGRWRLQKTLDPAESDKNQGISELALAIDDGIGVIGLGKAHNSDGGLRFVRWSDDQNLSPEWTAPVSPVPVLVGDTEFGRQLAVTESDIAIGAHRAEVNGVEKAGLVQVISRDSGAFTTLKMTPQQYYEFGNLLTMHEGTLVAAGHGQTAFVYEKNAPGDWKLQQELKVQAEEKHRLSHSSCLAEDWLALTVSPPHIRGVPHSERTEYFSVHLFRQNAGQWSCVQRLTESNGSPMDPFGTAIQIQGKWMAIGAPRHNAQGVGAIHLYALEAGRWRRRQTLIPEDSIGNSSFGMAIAMDGDRLAVASPNSSNIGSSAGAVYVYDLRGEQWIQQPEIIYGVDTSTAHGFGNSLALLGDRLLVGAADRNLYDGEREVEINSSGAAYLFHFDGARWIQSDMFLAPEHTDHHKQHFGSSVAMELNKLFISASREFSNGGAVYILESDAADFEDPSMSSLESK